MAENNIDPEQIRQINEALLDLTGTVRQTEIAMANMNKAQQAQSNKAAAAEKKKSKLEEEEIKNLETFNSAISNVNASGWNAGLEHLAKTSPKTAIGLEALATAASGFVKGTLQMSKALHEGERGAEVGAKAVTTFAESISNAGKLIGAALMFIPGLGIAARVAGAALALFSEGVKKSAELNEMGARQNDKVFKSFNELSKSGLVAAGGMSEVFSNLQTMRMTTAELEKFNSLLVSNSKDIKMFGATTADGASQFAKVSGKVYDDFNQSLGMLGVTAEEQREHTLRYMAQQTRLGMMQGKSVSDLAKGSKDYIEELDRLAMITGASRKEQEEARDAMLKIEQLRAAMFIAQERGDAVETARLKRGYELASAIYASGDKRGGAGAAQYFAGRGIVGAESAAFESTYRGSVKALEQGKSVEDAFFAGVQSGKERLREGADTIAVGGDLKALITDVNTIADNAAKLEQTKALMAQGKTLEEALREVQKRKVDEPDPKTKANVEMIEAQQRVAIKLDSALDKFYNSTAIYKNASAAMLKSAELLADFVSDPLPTTETQKSYQSVGGFSVNSSPTGLRMGPPASSATNKPGGTVPPAQSQPARVSTAPQAAATPSSAMPPVAAPSRSNVSFGPPGAAASAGAATTPAPVRPSGGAGSSSAPPSGPTPNYSSEGQNTGGGAQETKPRTGGDGIQGSPRKSTEAAIFHHTGGRSLSGAMSTLQSRGLAYHYLIDRDGKVVPYMADNAVAYHAGPTNKNPKVGNWNTIGIASLANNNADVTKEQMEAAVKLNQDLSGKYGYGSQNVFGHGQVTSHKGAEEGMALVNAIKGGVRDTNPQAKYGGILSGPMTGYPVTLHGNEAVVPLTTDSLLEKLGTTPAASLEKPTSTSSEMNNIFMMLTEKFDQMIEKLSDGVNIQDKILKYSRA